MRRAPPPLPWALLACALALAACDRRRTDPPTESSTADSRASAQAAGARGSGQATGTAARAEPGAEQTPERTACSGLSGTALADCQQRAGTAPAPQPQQPAPQR